ncbi:MAG TPA: DUF58 domain-containing protein [Atribacterota bacterium]|nr:DUF58 domain-containing protein [Atribacterota bacterium]
MNNSDHNYPLSSIFTEGFFRFFVFILLFISLLYEQKSLILISILVLAMFYGSKLWSTFSAKNIHYSFDAEKKKGFPGEMIALQAVVSNDKFLPIWLKLKIPIDKKLNPSLDSDPECLCEECNLLWYDRSSWQWKLTAKHRGCFQIGPPFLETGDLLGFFQQRRYLSQSVEMIIYPQPVSLNFLSSPVKELFGKPGLKSPVKDPVYPVAVHDYCHGEPARYIHWKASARHDRLQSKVFEPSSQRKTLFVIDVSSFQKNRHEDLFEKTLEVIAAIAMEFEKQGSPYGILSNGEMVGNDSASLPIATGPEQLSMAMELLARLQMKTAVSIEKILFKENIIPGGTGCIYSSCTLNKKNIQITQFLRQQRIAVYFMTAKVPRHIIDHHINFFLLDEIHGGILDSKQNRTLNE